MPYTEIKMGKIIAVANQKGGVGKTTTAVNLSACLGLEGKKILVIDADPQGNTTSGFGLDKNSCDKNIYGVLTGTENISDCIVAAESKNISVCPSNMDLLGVELIIDKLDNKEFILRDAIDEIKDKYDFIFIDCPPALNYVTINCLAAADSVLIPIQCEYFALEGVADLTKNISYIKQTINPSIQIEGVLLTMFDTRTNLSMQVAADVKECFPGKVYKVAIPRNTRLGEAPSYGLPVIYYDKYCKGTEAYKLLAAEFLKQQRRKK